MMASLASTRIAVIGAGAIGGAVIERLLGAGDARPENVVACETREVRRNELAQRLGVRTTADPAEAVDADLIILAVPPLEVSGILEAIRDRLNHHPVVVSFAGAVPLGVLESALPRATPIIRVNPNSPSLVGNGFNPVTFGSNVTGPARALAARFLNVLGKSPEVGESVMNLYTAVTAVGPTYFLPVFDAMITAALEGGLSRQEAVAAAVETALGTAMLVAQRPEDPEHLKLLTGLRPLRDAEVRDLVKAAIADAASRMESVQQKVTAAQKRE